MLMLTVWQGHHSDSVIIYAQQPILFTLTPGVPFLELVDLRHLTTMLCKLLIFLRLHSWDLECRRHWSVFSGARVLGHLYVKNASKITGKIRRTYHNDRD
jgi:hypothetical protein